MTCHQHDKMNPYNESGSFRPNQKMHIVTLSPTAAENTTTKVGSKCKSVYVFGEEVVDSSLGSWLLDRLCCGEEGVQDGDWQRRRADRFEEHQGWTETEKALFG